MEFKSIKEEVTIYDTVQTASAEYPIECDFILPDYCDDVVRILKCSATAQITDKSVMGDKLQIEGSIFIRVLYITDGGGLRSASNKMPFSKSFDTKMPADRYFVKVNAITDYVNCRLINQRRIDIRGAVTIGVKVSASRSEEVIADASGGGVQLKKSSVTIGKIVGEVSKQFTVREDLEIAKSNFAMRDVVMSRAFAKVTDYKVISNKVIVKGQLTVVSTVTDNATGIQTLEHEIPISQIVDLEGADEDSLCFVRFDIISSDITMVNELDDKVLAAVVQICVTVRAHKQSKLSVISDVYSTDFELNVTAEPKMIQQVAAVVNEDYPVKFRFQLPPDEIDRVADTWCEIKSATVVPEGNTMLLKASADVSLIGYNSSGEIIYLERTEPIEYRRDVGNGFEDMAAEFTASVASMSYSIESGSNMELRLQTAIEGCIYGSTKKNVTVEIIPQQDKPKVRDNEASLTIYYADAGEDVWDIAKQYNTSPEKIVEENSMDDTQIASRMMLLIPSAD